MANGEIFSLLNNTLGKGNQYECWEWWRSVDNQWKNLANERTLLRLWELNDGVQYFSNEMIKIKQVVENRIQIDSAREKDVKQ